MRLKFPIRKFLERERVARVATMSRNGVPHVVPVCHVLEDGKISFAAADKTVASAVHLKEVAPDMIEFLARAVNTSYYKLDTRVNASRIRLEHALGKPKQAVVPAREGRGELTWEALLEKIRKAAEESE